MCSLSLPRPPSLLGPNPTPLHIRFYMEENTADITFLKNHEGKKEKLFSKTWRKKQENVIGSTILR